MSVCRGAEKESLTHLHFLDLLLGAQADARRERTVARRIREARFAEGKSLEGFDWQFNPKAFDRAQIEELASGDFIRRRRNLVLVGWSGVGKSHIIQALGQKACVQGYRVLYRTSAELLSDLTASLADKTLPARLRAYARPELLIIDEFGFDRIERAECPQAAHLLYKIIASRNQKRSTALVTNVDFEKWGEYMTDGPLAMAFLDRLVEGAIILKVKGKSHRARQSKGVDSPAQKKNGAACAPYYSYRTPERNHTPGSLSPAKMAPFFAATDTELRSKPPDHQQVGISIALSGHFPIAKRPLVAAL
jgi:DNA replication protein DnaC